jgi:cyclic pyranopterin phosphate synthase
MPAGGAEWTPTDRLPTLEEMADLVIWIGRVYPLEKIRLTGGEPTLRRGLPNLVRMLAAAPEVPEVAMTTNGTRLEGLAPELAAAGMDRVNISLDTLDPERYRELTRGGRVADAVAGVHAALAAGLGPVRLNTVLRRSSWREDVPALLDFASKHRLEPRFLELMRTGTERFWSEDEFVSASVVRRWLEDRTGQGVDVVGGRDPARTGLVHWRGESVTVGWITPVSDPFCGDCSRLRLDARGRLRRCLMDPEVLPLGGLLATGDQAAVRRRVGDYMAGKVTPDAMEQLLPMVNLGG